MTAHVLDTTPADLNAAPDRPGRLYMSAVLRPNRSLSRPAFFCLIGVITAMAAGLGAVYAAMGAWPVLGFFGLDIVLVVLAFRLSYRQGKLTETVNVTAEAVDVTRRFPSGAVTHYSAPSYWARVDIDDPVRHHSQVRVRSQGGTLILGSFLAPEERAEFAHALRSALEAARNERAGPAGESG